LWHSYAEQFDQVKLDQRCLLARLTYWNVGSKQIPATVKSAIDIAYQNIYTFHAAQLQTEAKVSTPWKA
jgi:histidinol dehydrogenase